MASTIVTLEKREASTKSQNKLLLQTNEKMFQRVHSCRESNQVE